MRPLTARLIAAAADRCRAVRASDDQGAEAIQIAIGIGAAAAIALGLYGAYKAGITDLTHSWFFGTTP
ncbi:hypothetical protein Lfu02_75900 [Longispora fulva]|uniref:Uncharacterized protein n=1 Tax=Longispora fulva TaxID=619741 RepID=A0A8J7GQJ7_9ACTN|nr:hypothetical protein [Longispora fulva]MBG6136273.1 hypothetical protein [Longispora fulva]GIG63218.1 hypothetical protein Lfu02_75900 [Longispora fulva]